VSYENKTKRDPFVKHRVEFTLNDAQMVGETQSSAAVAYSSSECATHTFLLPLILTVFFFDH